MNALHRPTALLAGVLLMALSSPSVAQVGRGLLDPNVATTEELGELPGMTEAIVAALVEQRPFANAVALDGFLAEQELDEEARDAFYATAFVHVNLNTADSKTLQLIPGVGKRMVHELDEYRPWKTWKQFDKEIGKYVKEKEVARLWRYVVIVEAQTDG
jgi:DNA uptake protein ComE-like DNA-binding protein